MKPDISILPDYAALKKLASALWQQDNTYHGAAIIVGAGFSRSAASTGDITSKLPLWNDFSKTLAKELESENTDPLRLAEEYCAYFGKQALHDLIKNKVNDTAWIPGELYRSLLELPWSEVLTTNWDTLLERASEDIHQPVYSIVSKQTDLSSARSPRIVKLHGTINITEDLIFTQEDYRKYPERNAAFVNFARQVFIENELCLLGFSGDDPNFLQWTGWVRDHLSSHSRRIYLVGALNLNSAKRKYLESINIAPIDLGVLVADYDDRDTKHSVATGIFIKELQKLKPKQAWEWELTRLSRTTLSGEELNKTSQDSNYAAGLLERQITALETDRRLYPGWLVCPARERWELQNQINDPYPNPKNLAEMEPDSRAKLLYEIVWRYSLIHEPIPLWLAQELLSICDPAKNCVLTKKQQLEVALQVMKSAHWSSDAKFRSIEQIASIILERNAKHWPESSNELAYHQAIMARDKFDYPVLEKNIDKITPTDSAWKLKKAALFAEVGKFDKGEELVAEAYRELLVHYRQNRHSIYVLSRLAWAHWLINGIISWTPGKEIKAFHVTYQSRKCSPSDHIEHIKNRISKALDKQRERHGIQPSFEPGRYIDKSNSVVFSNELHPLLLLEGISNTVGMPLRWKNIDILTKQAAELAELEEMDWIHRFTLAIRTANSDTSEVLNKVFSRTQIACLPLECVNFLLSNCTEAINYWSVRLTSSTENSLNYAIERLRIFIEVLARVSVRATPEQAKQVFRLATSLSKKRETHNFWLFDSLKHLVEFTLKTIPEAQHHELLLEALLFPIQTEINVSEDCSKWPNPIINTPGNREQNTALDRRIDEIIDKIAPCSSNSASALLRLLPLIQKNFLTADECNKIAGKIWGAAPSYQSLPETGLFKYALFELPSKDPYAVKSRVRHYLFENTASNMFNNKVLMDIAGAAQAENTQELPSEVQAVDYLEKLLSWEIENKEHDFLGITKREEGQTAKLIGKVLARSIAPALSSTALNEENFQKLHVFYDGFEAPETLIAFIYFAVADESFIERVEKLIRQGLYAKDANTTAYSSYAILKWRELQESPVIDKWILRLIYLIGSGHIIGLPALLWTANEMCDKGYLKKEELESLAEIVPVVFDNSDYKNIALYSRESVSISLVRAACVRLARSILDKKNYNKNELLRVLEEAKQDPLPEVRFA